MGPQASTYWEKIVKKTKLYLLSLKAASTSFSQRDFDPLLSAADVLLWQQLVEAFQIQSSASCLIPWSYMSFCSQGSILYLVLKQCTPHHCVVNSSGDSFRGISGCAFFSTESRKNIDHSKYKEVMWSRIYITCELQK